MILNLLLLFLINGNIKEEVAIENLVGNWERVCIENDALGFEVSHCNFFGDQEMAIILTIGISHILKLAKDHQCCGYLKEFGKLN